MTTQSVIEHIVRFQAIFLQWLGAVFMGKNNIPVHRIIRSKILIF